ncbi:DUF1566 domain-containing protein (plasmid) [Diaphorobacter sp. HDW4B]|uniref:Lcl C-terminal domain-containing protein n=1 Tax=Diaphorobacter sp. HDW4B TaxID=2714925 RepID=UPI0014084C5B|nr:DUF1566 domain-containing protein [Diaphorobacter sp. HDW4B]QIL74229.1 DUF1566 domain-containing protein [Diaphorobacter sp. HDW4B]
MSCSPLPLLHGPALYTGRRLLAALLGSVCFVAPAGAAAPYVVQSNGTVADTSHELVWDRCSLGQSGSNCATGAALTYSLPNAKTEVTTRNSARYLGYTDWRLPSQTELQYLVVMGIAPMIDQEAFPGTVADHYKTLSGSTNPYAELVVNFGSGGFYYRDTGQPHYVRLVRSGQPFASSGSTPVVSAVGLGSTSGTGTTLNATSSAAGTGYWLVVPSGSSAPSARQVVDGVTYGTVSTVFGGSAPMGATTATPFGITGLVTDTAYDAYFVAVDAALNASAVSGPLSFTPTRANQTLSFGTAPSMVFGGATGTVTATSASPNSGNPLSYSVPSTTSVCSVNANSGVVMALAAGTCTVAANQAGDSNYNPATPVTQDILIGKASQSITFNTAPSMMYGGATATVGATGGASGMAVSFSSQTPSVCTVSGSTVAAVAAGTCMVAANQEGDSNYNPATPVTQDILIAKASQSITFNTAPSVMYGGATATVGATGGASGLAVSFSSQTPSVCTVSGSTVTAVAAGTCTVAADQAGNANYSDAPQVTRAITVATAPITTASGSAPGGGAVTASFTGGSAGCGYQTTGFNPVSSVPGAPPAGVAFPQGVFAFVTNAQCAGNTLDITIKYPQALPADAKYYKFGPEAGNPTPHWYVLSGAVITSTGSTSEVRFSITDNGVGDSDPRVGVIADPGGPGVLTTTTTAVPTLGEWSLMLLMGLMGLMALLGISGIRARRML